MKTIELRSDTFTKPTAGMLQAMMQAEVGDDVFEEDPDTIRLETRCAQDFGYDAALFCLSGTMANQIAIMVHTQAGDEVVCDALSHIYLYEGGGMMANAHASVQLLQGNQGRLSAIQVQEAIRQENIHHPITRLVSLENTVNKGGGAIYDFGEIQRIRQVCLQHQLKLHLDGARLFNALVETHETPAEYGAQFDSISICLSKGLGTPMGTVLLGNRDFIRKARRIRKRLGGGWRQSGYLAAAGIYALDHHVERLQQDHHRARELGHLFSTLPFVQNVYPVVTNIVIFSLPDTMPAQNLVNEWMALGLKTSPFGKHQIRLVTHMDFTDDHLQQVADLLKSYR